MPSGIFTLNQQIFLSQKNLWGTSSGSEDTYFSSVMLLLHGDGSYTDSSSNSTTVTTYNSATTNNSIYKFGTGSLDFTASTSHARFSNSNLNFGTGDWTIELWWYQPASIESYGVIFDVDASSNFFVGFSPDTSALRVYSSPNGVNYYSSAHGMTAGNWYHLAFVRSGSTITVYKNGTSLGSVAAGSSSYSPASGYTTAYLSSYGASVGSYRCGSNIDEFRITKGVARYTTDFTPPTAAFPNNGSSGASTTDPNFSSVVALLHCDGSNGSTTFTDSSSSAKAITAGNTSISTSIYKYGTGSANFGGSNNGYLSFNNEISISGNYTIEFWAYLTGISGNGYSIGFGAISVNSQIPQFYSNGSFSYYNNGSSFSTGTGKFSLNTWFHCAVVRSSNTVKIYVNGVDTGASGSDSNTLYIKNISGYNGGSSGYNVLGYFDEIRISNIARYTTNFTPPTAAFPNSA